jgi:hypothetical protein
MPERAAADTVQSWHSDQKKQALFASLSKHKANSNGMRDD